METNFVGEGSSKIQNEREATVDNVKLDYSWRSEDKLGFFNMDGQPAWDEICIYTCIYFLALALIKPKSKDTPVAMSKLSAQNLASNSILLWKESVLWRSTYFGDWFQDENSVSTGWDWNIL